MLRRAHLRPLPFALAVARLGPRWVGATGWWWGAGGNTAALLVRPRDSQASGGHCRSAPWLSARVSAPEPALHGPLNVHGLVWQTPPLSPTPHPSTHPTPPLRSQWSPPSPLRRRTHHVGGRCAVGLKASATAAAGRPPGGEAERPSGAAGAGVLKMVERRRGGEQAGRSAVGR